MYQERRSHVPGSVVWRGSTSTSSGPKRVLPDGCMDLFWDGHALRVAGPDTRAHVSIEIPGTELTAIRFAPGTGPAVVGVPTNELRDQRVPLGALWSGARVRRLTERFANERDIANALESVALHQLTDAIPDPLCASVVARLGQGCNIGDASRAVGLSDRQLLRRCHAAFGYGPKTLARVLRLTDALRMARDGVQLAKVATNAGYVDQAHLCRDVRTLAGVPIRDLLDAPE